MFIGNNLFPSARKGEKYKFFEDRKMMKISNIFLQKKIKFFFSGFVLLPI